MYKQHIQTKVLFHFQAEMVYLVITFRAQIHEYSRTIQKLVLNPQSMKISLYWQKLIRSWGWM